MYAVSTFRWSSSCIACLISSVFMHSGMSVKGSIGFLPCTGVYAEEFTVIFMKGLSHLS